MTIHERAEFEGRPVGKLIPTLTSAPYPCWIERPYDWACIEDCCPFPGWCLYKTERYAMSLRRCNPIAWQGGNPTIPLAAEGAVRW